MRSFVSATSTAFILSALPDRQYCGLDLDTIERFGIQFGYCKQNNLETIVNRKKTCRTSSRRLKAVESRRLKVEGSQNRELARNDATCLAGLDLQIRLSDQGIFH